jgi:hypothetical protein
MTWSKKLAAAACLTLLSGALGGRHDAARASEAGAPKPASTASHCEEAIVNPVSGNAECVRPAGAPVDPPPPRPPPTREACRRHRALGIEACRRTSLKHVQTDAAAPPK